jgi:hypothetical protein
MGQLGDRPCLAVEPLAELRIGGELLRQDFDGDGPIEPRVARAIDLAHAPGADRRENLVRAEAGAWLERHSY